MKSIKITRDTIIIDTNIRFFFRSYRQRVSLKEEKKDIRTKGSYCGLDLNMNESCENTITYG